MIKVELQETTAGTTQIVFISSKPTDQSEVETLDKLLKTLAGPFPRRGGFIAGSPGALSIEVNTKE
jgi:hypothetical protein